MVYGQAMSRLNRSLNGHHHRPIRSGIMARCIGWLPKCGNRGRIALMQENLAGEPIYITPGGFNIRTAVHEYGGRCFCLVGDSIIFNNYVDGQLCWQSINPLLTLFASSEKASPVQQLSRNSGSHNELID